MRLKYHDQRLTTLDTEGKVLQFVNCVITRKGSKLGSEVDLWVENGKVVDPEIVFFEQRRRADVQIDCEGLVLAPGFIDIQVNGAFGVDFTSASAQTLEESIKRVASGLLKYGVTSFCPTVVTSLPSVYHSILPLIRRTSGGSSGAGVLGVHLEGPYISKEKRGCHPQECVRSTLTTEDLERTYGNLDCLDISMVTLAPELPGAEDAIRYLRKRGIKVSLGHSSADFSDGAAACRAGASCLTHLFNAMDSYHHRDPSLIGLLASEYIESEPAKSGLFYGLIADGIHTHDSALRIAHRTHPHGLVLVTDCISATGLGDGTYRNALGDQSVTVEGSRAFLENSSTAAGSVATMPLCVSHLADAASCSIEEAIKCATLHPSSFLGLESRKGSLDVGSDADFVLVDANTANIIDVKATFIGANCVFAK